MRKDGYLNNLLNFSRQNRSLCNLTIQKYLQPPNRMKISHFNQNTERLGFKQVSAISVYLSSLLDMEKIMILIS